MTTGGPLYEVLQTDGGEPSVVLLVARGPASVIRPGDVGLTHECLQAFCRMTAVHLLVASTDQAAGELAPCPTDGGELGPGRFAGDPETPGRAGWGSGGGRRC
jgi:hypothetical protein